MAKTAINPTRAENYPQWYQEVIAAAEMAENSPVRGCMVIRPWGFAIWERLQRELDKQIKATGAQNAYFPLLIPVKYLAKEAEHVEGFAKECAVVTHHRLESDGKGGLKPAGELEEPMVIRPTSETIIGEMMAKWVQSYRDLPLKLNQWANVMRWEMRTRLFLRTSEFLWQEGHTAHATESEANAHSREILDLYSQFAENFLAMPVITGEKTITERFPGAVDTYCIEAMMQDGKALQAGTSHFLGQNFAKASGIKFSDQAGDQHLAWTTSWGVSTRLIGGLIMTHADDDGMVCPPTLAPQQIIIQPIYKTDAERDEVLKYCNDICTELETVNWQDEALRAHIDDRDLRGGEKSWGWVKKGVPLRLEIGPRDVAKNAVCLKRRDQAANEKTFLSVADFTSSVSDILTDMQSGLLNKAKKQLSEKTVEINSLDEFKNFFKDESASPGFAICYAKDCTELDDYIKPYKVSARCIPLAQSGESGKCIFTGSDTNTKIIFAKAY
jgi:prolyl-tRNA synthetase